MANNSRGPFIQDNWDYWSAPPRGLGTNLFGSEYQNVSSDVSTNAGAYGPIRLGQTVRTYDDRVFRYIEASGGALIEGDCLAAATVNTSTATANTSTTDPVTVTAVMSQQIYANQFRGGWMYAAVGTGLGFRRRIVSNQAAANGALATFQIERPFPVALVNATIRFWHPNRMVIFPAAAGNIGSVISGVSFGAISAPVATGAYAGGTSYYGWMQVEGSCDAVKFAGSAVAASATQGPNLVPSATLGAVAQASVATVIGQQIVGRIEGANLAAITTPGLISAILNRLS